MAFGELGDRLHWHVEVQSTALALQLVAAGGDDDPAGLGAVDGAGLVVVAIPVEDVQLRRTIGVVTRRGVPFGQCGFALLARIETALVARFHPHGADGADGAAARLMAPADAAPLRRAAQGHSGLRSRFLRSPATAAKIGAPRITRVRRAR